MQSPHFTGNESIKMVPGTLQQFSQGSLQAFAKLKWEMQIRQQQSSLKQQCVLLQQLHD